MHPPVRSGAEARFASRGVVLVAYRSWGTDVTIRETWGRAMIRTGEEYRESLRDGRAVWIDGERVEDVTVHPAFTPIVDGAGADLRPGARAVDTGGDVLHRRGDGAALPGRLEAAADAGGLDRQADRGGHGARRPVRDRDACRRRDRRRDVVAVRRAGCAERDRPLVLGAHTPSRQARGAGRPVPRLGEHRSEGRSRAAPAGPGSRCAAARDRRDRQRDRGSRRQVRDRGGVCEPGVRQADDRRLGRRRAVRLRGRVRGRHGGTRGQAHLPLDRSPAVAATPTIRCRTGSTRSTR